MVKREKGEEGMVQTTIYLPKGLLEAADVWAQDNGVTRSWVLRRALQRGFASMFGEDLPGGPMKQEKGDE